MNNNEDYGFKIKKYSIGEGGILFGLNFNTNKDFDIREFYLNLYLFKYQIVIGWFN